jgi:hypothetical protein
MATPEGGGVPASTGYVAVGVLACAVALPTAALTGELLRRPAAARPARVTGR